MGYLRCYSILTCVAATLAALIVGGAAPQPPQSDDVYALNARLMELYRTGQFDAAIPLAKRALELREATLPADDPYIAQSLNNLASLYQGVGRFTEAEPLFKRALQMYENALPAGHPEIALSLNNLGGLYRVQGRFREAEPLYKRALTIREAALPADDPFIAQSLNNLADLYQEQERFADAERLFQRALKIYEKALAAGDPTIALGLSNLASLYVKQDLLDKAEPLLTRALDILEKAFPGGHPFIATVTNNLGPIYKAQGRWAESERYYRRALELYQKALPAGHPTIATSLTNVANLYRMQGRLDEAEPLYHSANAMLAAVLPPDSPVITQNLNNLAGVALMRGETARAAEFWRRSTGNIVRRLQRDADDVGRALASDSRSELKGSSWQFWALVKAIHQLQPQDRSRHAMLAAETFQIAQWVQGSEAARSLAQMALRGAKRSPALSDIVRERQDLVGEWRARDATRDTMAALAQQSRDRAAEGANAARLAAIEARIGKIDARLKVEFPDYAALARPESLSIPEVQAALRPNEALVFTLDTPEFGPAPEETFVWVVTKTDMRWVKSGLGTKALTERVAALRCGLDEEEWSGNTRANKCAALLNRAEKPGDDDPPPFHLGIAYELYRSLFGPVDDLIKGKRLLIVPSGPLTSLPFHVLVTQKSETSLPATFEGYRNVAWLGRSHAITVLPSVASLKALRGRASAKRPKAPADYIGIGNPILKGTSGECRVSKVPERCPTVELASARPQLTVASAERAAVRGRGGRRNAGKGLGEVYAKGAEAAVLIKQVQALCPLPDTDYELRCVAERFPTGRYDLYRDKLATETDLRRLNANGTLARYRIVHFATHGLVAGDLETLAKRQGEPALVLTPPDQPADADDDGLLTASEVAQLRLNADWVVLSACSTAAGDGATAEALSGLARAFFYAGTRALLVSHWPVYSDAAVQLTTRTFAELDRDPRIGGAEAFRRAMVALTEDRSLPSNAHPAVWAPFVVVGEGGSDDR